MRVYSSGATCIQLLPRGEKMSRSVQRSLAGDDTNENLSMRQTGRHSARIAWGRLHGSILFFEVPTPVWRNVDEPLQRLSRRLTFPPSELRMQAEVQNCGAIFFLRIASDTFKLYWTKPYNGRLNRSGLTENMQLKKRLMQYVMWKTGGKSFDSTVQCCGPRQQGEDTCMLLFDCVRLESPVQNKIIRISYYDNFLELLFN